MANKSGMFLTPEERESLLRDVAKHEKRASRSIVSDSGGSSPRNHGAKVDGCRICTLDNDHTNMLLCEKCSAEYHFYCIGLSSVPTEDWFCGKYKKRWPAKRNVGLKMIQREVQVHSGDEGPRWT